MLAEAPDRVDSLRPPASKPVYEIMSETVTVEVLARDAGRVRLRMHLRHPGEQALCTSRAFLVAQLQEALQWAEAKDSLQPVADTLFEAGLHVWGDDLDDAGVDRLEKEAARWVESVELRPLHHAIVLGRGRHVLRVEDDGGDPTVDVTLSGVAPSLADGLAKGLSWGTSPPVFGDLP